MFRPPFCPHRGCRAHFLPPRRHWFVCNGFYTSRLCGRVQRYRCRLCGGGFSRQSFELDYFAKRRLSYHRLQRLVCSCVGIRQAARILGVHRGTVLNKIMRFSRQTIAAHARLLDQCPLTEDLAADGLESFWLSQYMPNNFNILAGEDSRFLFDWEAVTLRRSGAMTERQKKRRAELEQRYRADPSAVRRSFFRLLDTATGLIERAEEPTVTFSTDCHPDYRRALEAHRPWQLLCEHGRAVHQRISSRAARTADNPLAPVNIIDRQIRTDLAEHVRQTIRYARNSAHSRERFALWAFDYNYCTPHRVNERAGELRSHAEAAGLQRQAIDREMKQLYRQRAFFSHTVMPLTMLAVWLRIVRTPLRKKPEYLPAYMLA